MRGCAAALSEMLEGALYRTRGIDVPRELKPLAPVRASPISTKEDS